MRKVALVLCLLGVGAVCLGCKTPYRVGERVRVVFDKSECPGFVLSKKGQSHFRIHFDFEGYTWEETVSLERVRGIADSTVPNCPPPRRVARALGIPLKKDAEAVTPYKVGDHIRVRWRDSIYNATILEVVAADKLRVHYDDHESVWDEIIATERIASRR